MEPANWPKRVWEIFFVYHDHRKRAHLVTALTAIEQGYSPQEIAIAIGMSKGYVTNLLVYGLQTCPSYMKEAVKERDGKKCVVCSSTRPLLHVHHIFNPSDHSEGNLMTVCARCHRMLHKLKKNDLEGYSAKIDSLILTREAKDTQVSCTQL